MSKAIVRFLRDESGAVAADWVVLTAAISGFGVSLVSSVSSGTMNLSGSITSALSGAMVAQSGSYSFRTMTDDAEWWNSIPERRAQMREMTNDRLNLEWETYAVHYFEVAIAAGDNSNCIGCRGAGNRLDLMNIVLAEHVSRGIDTPEMHMRMAQAEREYTATFGR